MSSSLWNGAGLEFQTPGMTAQGSAGQGELEMWERVIGLP